MDYRIILASASPRRKEILGKLNFDFEIIPSDCEEITTETEPAEVVRSLAKLKAEDIWKRVTAAPFTAADGIKAGGKKALEEKNGVGLENSRKTKGLVVIGSDTIVDHAGRIMGKPHSEEEAFEMIRSYAGDFHYVHTGVCILIEDMEGNRKIHNFTVSSKVNVVDMTDWEIRNYVATKEPMDKAGAYALQGLFAPYISSIEGDYYTIVGLPLCEVYRILKEEHIISPV